MKLLLAFAVPTGAVAAILTLALLAGNPEARAPGAAAELALAMLWISTLLHGAVAGGLLLVGALARSLTPRLVRAREAALLGGSLVGFDAAWALWNRLGMAHQIASVRPFLTASGLVQNAALIVLAALITAAVARRPWRTPAAVAATAIAGALLTAGLAEEKAARHYPCEEILAAACAASPPRAAHAPAARAAPAPRVIVFAVDGLGWSALVPLMEAGRVVNLAAMVREGAFGTLGNGSESLSPRIWTTIFTGRPVEEHGIGGFVKLQLPRSGLTLPNLLLLRPSVDTFFGIAHLLARMPNPGLWKLALVDARDRRAETLWELASRAGRRVVVANAIASTPVRPVRGAVLDLRDPASPWNTYPPELIGRWEARPLGDPAARSEKGFRDSARRLEEEAAFFTQLVREERAELAVWYTHFLDTASHWGWDFYARGEFFLRELPRALPPPAWSALVREHAGARPFRACGRIDEIIGELRAAFPQSVLVVCSDHGWTYSGYEHFGSPEGVILLAGPGVRARCMLSNPGVEDVAPTILALLGLPPPADLPGRVLSEALLPAPEQRPRPVAAAGAPAVTRHADAALPPAPTSTRLRPTPPDPPEMARLRALGYLD